jgi:glucokinase-like ROK family protein
LKALRDRQLIEEAGPGLSDGGRRPTLLTFRKGSGYVVAVQLGQRNLIVAITNLSAEILSRMSHPVDVREGPSAVLPQVRDLIAQAISKACVDRSLIKGIGMGIPGPVDFQAGHPVYPPVMPGWHDYTIREYFEAEFGWPIFIDNDANLMAVGEQWTGLGRGVENFVFVGVTPGVRCGTVCRGEIYRGSDGCAGEIGHIRVTSDGVVCQCGRTGCLEAVAGAAALARAAEDAAREGRSRGLAAILDQRGSLTAEDLATAVERGDPVALELVRNAGMIIGQTLGYVVNFYNPHLIVIGGGVAHLVDLLLPSIREAIYRFSLASATKELLIRRSALGDDAGLIGAAALLLRERFGLAPAGPRAILPIRRIEVHEQVS